MTLLRRLLIRNMPLQRQLVELAQCGIVPKPEVGLDDLLARHREAEYERSPFKLLLRVLGSEREIGDWQSDNIWLLNADCIGGTGDYTRFANRMSTLACGALPIGDVQDTVDLRQGTARLSFMIGGRPVEWEARILERWIDPAIVSRFAELLEGQETENRFTFLNLAGRDCLIGCSTPGQIRTLRKTTGLDFEWLG